MLSKNQAKYFRQLKQKKFRDSEGLFVIEGTKMVNEALLHHRGFIETVICTRLGVENLVMEEKVDILETDYETISKISSLKTPQHIIAIARQKQNNIAPLPKKNELIIALDNIKDPGNLGTILRLADWFGVQNIVCSKDTVEMYNPKVVQASMGSIFRSNVYTCDLSLYLKKVINIDIPVYGAMLAGKSLYKSHLNQPAIIVMGNESEGIGPIIQPFIDHFIHIPNFSVSETKTESLNVSIATSIILSEFRRQLSIQSEN